MKLPKGVTIAGLAVSVGAVLLDAPVQAALGTVLGDHAATKLAAIGALLAALGRALFGAKAPPTP